jgi:hypothetical protein
MLHCDECLIITDVSNDRTATMFSVDQSALYGINIAEENIQSNKMHFIIFRYSVFQYLVNQSNVLRSFMGALWGTRNKVTFHKTERAMYRLIHPHIPRHLQHLLY